MTISNATTARKAAIVAKAAANRDARAARQGNQQRRGVGPSNTPNPADMGKTWDYGAPAPTTFQGGSTGGMGGGTTVAPGMPDKSMLPPGAAFKKGGKVSASSRADGIAQRGKTRGKYI